MPDSTDLDRLRTELQEGDNVSQSRIDGFCSELRQSQGRDRSEEPIDLVNQLGRPTGLVAPRWLCHLLGLRHCCAHVLLWWHSERLCRTLVLQMRSWSKPDSPGLIDISVGGHAKSGSSAEDTAYSEMAEELGIRPKHLVGSRLESVGGYEHYNERSEERFHNAEWRAVFVGELPTENLSKIGFNDEEVVGLYLCSVRQVAALLEQTDRIASALKCSLPKVLEHWDIPAREPTAPGA